jgi:hypothetical protein
MNGEFDLVISETRSASLRVLSLIGDATFTDGKRYLDPPVMFAKNAESLRRQRHMEPIPRQPG